MRVLEYVLKDMKTPVMYLNISRLTDYRKDGHPSIYRPGYQAVQQEVHAQDCSHWCLPGVPDTWNELLYVSLLKSGRGSWRDWNLQLSFFSHFLSFFFFFSIRSSSWYSLVGHIMRCGKISKLSRYHMYHRPSNRILFMQFIII